jgi:hypothetical protein
MEPPVPAASHSDRSAGSEQLYPLQPSMRARASSSGFKNLAQFIKVDGNSMDLMAVDFLKASGIWRALRAIFYVWKRGLKHEWNKV